MKEQTMAKQKKTIKKRKRKCVGCGTTKNVTYGLDPYAHDVEGDDTKVYLCDTCRDNRADDI
jgi:hypothetical protein